MKYHKLTIITQAVSAKAEAFGSYLANKTELISELKKGEKSGFIRNMNRESFIEGIHSKYMAENEMRNQ
jgi:antitoxin ParD1/3/4